MLDFDISYFEEETRLGFTIPAFMKHAWAAQLKVLDRIDEICRDNNINSHNITNFIVTNYFMKKNRYF